MNAFREVALRAAEVGRVAGLDAAIDAAKEFGHVGLVPALTVLRDWPRAGAITRPYTKGRTHVRDDQEIGDR